jgi:hypothetical protein
MDLLMARLLEDEKQMEREEKETIKILKQQRKQREKSERGMMGEEEKPSRILRKQRKEEDEYLKNLEAQRRAQAEAKPSKQQKLTKFMSAKKK